MSWSDESLSAFLDGELPAAEMEQLARDLEADAALAARLERLARANRTFLAAASGIDAVPLPDRTQALLASEGGAGGKKESAHVIPFPVRRISAFVMEHRAIAAGLLCAAAVYGLGVATGPGQDVPAASGIILAGSPLHRALEGTPTGETVQVAGGVEIRPQLTFITRDDAYCRQYALQSGAGAVEGIACRGDDGWRLQVASFAPGRTAPSDYQSAASGRSAALEAFIETNIAGSPLNASEESAVFARGWRER
jgi:hypothetical protein